MNQTMFNPPKNPSLPKTREVPLSEAKIIHIKDSTIFDRMIPYTRAVEDIVGNLPVQFYHGNYEKTKIVTYTKGDANINLSFGYSNNDGYGSDKDDHKIIELISETMKDKPELLFFKYLVDASNELVYNFSTKMRAPKFSPIPILRNSSVPVIMIGKDGTPVRIYDTQGRFLFCLSAYLSRSLIVPLELQPIAGKIFMRMLAWRFPNYDNPSTIMTCDIEDFIVPSAKLKLRLPHKSYGGLQSFTGKLGLRKFAPLETVTKTPVDSTLTCIALSALLGGIVPQVDFMTVVQDVTIPGLDAFAIADMYIEKGDLYLAIDDKDPCPSQELLEDILGYLGVDVSVVPLEPVPNVFTGA
jgi:hypothetical protein